MQWWRSVVCAIYGGLICVIWLQIYVVVCCDGTKKLWPKMRKGRKDWREKKYIYLYIYIYNKEINVWEQAKIK